MNITPSLGFCKDGAEAAASVDSTLSSSFRKLGKKEAVTKQKVKCITFLCSYTVKTCELAKVYFYLYVVKRSGIQMNK